MKTILYYISEHGLGHLTRSIAIIRELQNHANIMIRNSNEIFLKKSLPSIPIFSGKTDQGPIISSNFISIDWEKTKISISDWYSNFNSIAENEKLFIKKKNPDIIISDISPIPLYSSNQLDIPSIAISNFTWLDVFSKLPDLNLNYLKSSYEKASLCIKLPLSTNMNIFSNKKNVGFVCKIPTDNNLMVRKKLNIDKSKFLIFINLPNFFNIKLKNFENFQVISTGAKTNFKNTVYIDPWIEGQNLVNASDLVICKCGYGMITECLTSGTPFQLIADQDHPEQDAILQQLSKYGIENSILDWKNGQIEIDFNNLEYFESFKNDNTNIKNIIKEFLK